MAKLYLKFKESVIREIDLRNGIITIGRLENNDISIDSSAVSGSHARIIGEGGIFTIEDLHSTNGTYVNESRISRQRLVHNAVITVGKHSLLFFDPVAVNVAESDQTVVMRKSAGGDATVVIQKADAKHSGVDVDRPRQFSPINQTIVCGASLPPLSSAETKIEKIGVLTVLKGKAERSSYLLNTQFATIGKSEEAEIRLKGFFAPKVAALVNRTQEGYSIAPADGMKLLVNGVRITGPHLLKPLDQVDVRFHRLQFSIRDV